jgi:hypothetical protein
MLKITHSAGFFSCCSIRFLKIIDYYNNHKKLPITVDSSTQFIMYKNNINKDITFDYFENYDNINIDINYDKIILSDDKREPQYSDYSKLKFDIINKLIKKYFTPSVEILNTITNIENKYNLDYDNICVLFYRGNDKNTETKICGYDEYIKYANEVLTKNPNIKFLIQSDETEFINYMLNIYPTNSFYLKDEIRHINKCNNTVDKIFKNSNYEFSKKYLAITVIMSKCKYVIFGSGNCSNWIIFYRGNVNNVYQNLNNEWLIH